MTSFTIDSKCTQPLLKDLGQVNELKEPREGLGERTRTYLSLVKSKQRESQLWLWLWLASEPEAVLELSSDTTSRESL